MATSTPPRVVIAPHAYHRIATTELVGDAIATLGGAGLLSMGSFPPVDLGDVVSTFGTSVGALGW